MVLRSSLAIFVSICLAASCADTDSDADDELRADERVPAPETEGLCRTGTCRAGFAGLEFVNASGASRNVYVNGELACTLEPDGGCEAEIEAATPALIHVTDEKNAETCEDPSATLDECICARFEILC